MKTIKNLTILLCVAGMLTGVSLARAGEDPKKPCCEATVAAQKDCKHKCCVTAAEKGKICKKCHPKQKKADDKAK